MNLNGNLVPLTTGPVTGVTGPSYAQSVYYPEDETNKSAEYEKEFHESFSKGTLRTRMIEYRAGKLTKRYIEVYLEFIVLSGMISNLDYLEFREVLAKE